MKDDVGETFHRSSLYLSIIIQVFAMSLQKFDI